jgi:hypothetical protein
VILETQKNSGWFYKLPSNGCMRPLAQDNFGKRRSTGDESIDADVDHDEDNCRREKFMSSDETNQIPLIQELRETCDTLLEQAQGYRHDLEHELSQVLSETDPYMHHVRALEHLLPRVRQLEDLIVEKVIRAVHEIVERDTLLWG